MPKLIIRSAKCIRVKGEYTETKVTVYFYLLSLSPIPRMKIPRMYDC